MKTSFARVAVACAVVGLVPGPVRAQTAETTDLAKAARYLAELRAVGQEEAGRIWGVPLAGPVLLVKPDSREVFASEADSGGILRASGPLYVGTWPAHEPLANTAVTWQGKRWSMLLWPLPADAVARRQLAFHEFFHRVQPALGFVGIPEADNQHLDQEQGRVWLKLELEALKAALRAPAGSAARLGHVRKALLFRQYRRSQYPAAAPNENNLELNEGLAEYTGVVAAKRAADATVAYLVGGVDTLYRNPTFVRSFAYCTVPAYGYLLRLRRPTWHRNVRRGTDLTALFATAFAYAAPPQAQLAAEAQRAAQAYGLSLIGPEEAKREVERQRRIAEYRRRFILTPGLVIPLVKMNISFDPRTMQPLGDAGTVYPQLKLSDNWGTLTVSTGALLGANWDKVTLSAPTHIAGQQVTGEGYVLLLNQGWTVTQAPDKQGYTLVHQP